MLKKIVVLVLLVVAFSSCETVKCIDYPVKDSYTGEYQYEFNNSVATVRFVGYDKDNNNINIIIPKKFYEVSNTYIKIDCAEVYLTN